MSNSDDSTGEPHRVATGVKNMLAAALRHTEDGLKVIDDPQAQALFETTADVLGGLLMAFDHFEEKTVTTWQ